ncbi:zinc finger CCCH domain-containing protein 13-like [Penaeus indicus]|uniref:zinc finger CCCH domain-containing protein 13-like n=1 Tax=Penaeus indicus TaxID=29960 RepID=UPI00300CDDE5
MREMAGDSHHHMSAMDKKQMHGQHGHRRSISSSSSSSSSSTSSSTSSSSSSSSTDTSAHRPGHKRDTKRKPRPSKRVAPSGDRSKLKKTKSASSSRKHSSSKSSKKSHPSKKDHDKVRSHKTSRSPTRRKSSMSKKLLSPGRKRSPSPSSRKSHKISPGSSKRSKSRKRSHSPRERVEYRDNRMAVPERSLSHGRDPSLGSHAGSSRGRDPRVDDRMRRMSPEQIGRDRYSSRAESPSRRYEKERGMEEYVEQRRERRSPISRSREVERKDPHRHRDYDRHERDHYDERRRDDPRREDREREQLRERELRERELRDRELLKERERVELMEREQERERERMREVDDRRGRYAREHEFAREREVVVRGGGREYEGEREFYSPRGRPEIDARVMPVDDRRAYEDPAYDRYQSERERSRYEAGRDRYEELSLHDRRGLPPMEDRRSDRRGPPIDTRFPDERRRSGGSLDPRAHEAWVEEHRGMERLERAEHFAPHVPPRHRHQPDWVGGRPPAAWERHKHLSNVLLLHNRPPSSEDEGIESALVPPRGGDAGTPPPPDQDQALMPGELWEYDPGRGSWVRRAADAPPAPEAESPSKKEKSLSEPPQEAESENGGNAEIKKRSTPEEPVIEEVTAKKTRVEAPADVEEPENTLQEKDTFSDISDDADDILNQEVGGYNDDDSRNLSSSQLEDSRNMSRENGPSYDDLLDDEEAIHLEEISDDELEEDRQAKFNVAGALDINWASLVRDTPATHEVAAGTALKRFSPAHLLARIGVSTRYARKEVIEKVRAVCAADAAKDEEPKDIEVPPVVDSTGVVRLIKAREESRQRILDSIGPNRRALCARQDIALRRQLCNLPEQDLLGDNPLLDKDLFRQSVSLLKSC